MLYRDRIFLLSFLTTFPLLHGSQNPDVITQGTNGKVTATIPGTGDSVSHTPSNTGGWVPVYEGQKPPAPTQTSSSSKRTNNGPGNSSIGGVLGFLYNAGRTSENEKRSLEAQSRIDKALAKAQNGIPLSSKDYEALGTADLSKKSTSTALPGMYNDTRPFTLTDKKETEAAVKATTDAMKHQEFDILPESPFKGLNDDNSDNGRGGVSSRSIGMGVGVGVAVAAKLAVPVAVPVAIPVAGGVAAGTAGTVIAGGTVAGTGTVTTGTAATTIVVGGGVAALAGPIAVGVCIGAVLGTGLSLIHDGIFNPGIGWFPSYEDRQAYYSKRNALKANKGPSSIPQSGSRGGSPDQPSNPNPNNNYNPNPKKPDDKDKKERKVNTVSKTEVLRKIKENYRYDNQSNLYKLKDNGKPIKCTRTGKDVHNIKWDYGHGDIEALKKNLDHMGSLDPVTFEMYKGPVVNRKE